MPTVSSPSLRITDNGPPPLPKESFIRRLFDRISPRYDLFNRISSFGLDQGWRRRAIQDLQLLPGMRVLDLASGTGDLALLAARQLLPLGKVVACDLSFPMLRYASRKFSRIPYAPWHIQPTQARAEALPFSDASFDAATVGFALRNVSDLEATFKELRRVLRPGGRLSLLEFGRPRHPLIKAGHHLWLSTGVPLLGWLTTGRLWPFLYLRRSILKFLSPEEVIQRLTAAGFTEPKAQPLALGAVTLYSANRP